MPLKATKIELMVLSRGSTFAAFIGHTLAFIKRKITLMKYFIVFVIICSISFYVAASTSDNLKPDGSILTEFDFHSTNKTAIRKPFINNLSDFPIARTLVCPSFSPESILNKFYGSPDCIKKYLDLPNQSVLSQFTD